MHITSSNSVNERHGKRYDISTRLLAGADRRNAICVLTNLDYHVKNGSPNRISR